jgi:predicted GNAT family acetyltransferase
MGLLVTQYQDADSFLDAAGEALYARASVNNLILGITERLVRDPQAYENPFFATAMDQKDTLLLAAAMTPPYNIVLAECAGAIDALSVLIEHINKKQIDVPGVTGPAELSEAFAREWERRTVECCQVEMYQRVYELRHVRLPKLPTGYFRVAHLDDSKVIAQWYQAFKEEAMGEVHALDLELAEKLIKDGRVFVWDQEGEPVSMAMKMRPLERSITISGVYTPPEHRRKGYATALVARLSLHLLDMGYEFINLFTDLENPTSNDIYQKIGFAPVCDFRMYKFIKEENS